MSQHKDKLEASIIIPAYNHEKYIVQTVESALNQDVNCEVVVIDDGSKDNTWQELQRFKKTKNVRLFTQKNQGTAPTLNRGMRLAKSNVVAILNSDDIFHPDRLKSILPHIGNKKHFWAFTGVELMDGESAPITEGPNHEWYLNALACYQKSGDLARCLLKENFICSTSNLVFTKDLVKKIGGFRPLLFINDLDFIFRALAVVPPFQVEDDLLRYRVHQDNTIAQGKENRSGLVFEFAWMLSQMLLSPEIDKLFKGVLLESMIEFCPESSLAVTETMRRFHKLSEKKREQLITDKNYRNKCVKVIDFQLRKAEGAAQLEQESRQLLNDNKQQAQQIEFLESELENAKNFAAAKTREADSVWRERCALADELENMRNSKGYKAAQFFADVARFRNPKHSGLNLAKALVPEKYVPLAKKIYHRNFNNQELMDQGQLALKKLRYKLLPKKKYTQTPYSGPLLSVIITCYNYGQYLDRVLESLKKQSCRLFEAILIDDGSTDQLTQNKVSEIEAASPAWLKVIRQENQGVIAARNTAIAQARGKYIFPLDADDQVEPDFVEKALLYLECCPDNTFVYPWTYSLGQECFVWRTKDSLPDEILSENKMGFSVFPKAAWKKCGGYSQEMAHGYEDWEFCVKLVANGFVGRAIHEPLYLYDVKEESRNMDAMKKHQDLTGLIQSMHGAEVERRSKRITMALREQWVMRDAFVNLAEKGGEQAYFIDLCTHKFDPAPIFPRLFRLASGGGKRVVAVCPVKYRSFFNLSRHPNLTVFHPETSTPFSDSNMLKEYISAKYRLEEITPETIPAPEGDNGKIRILYIAPWLITGGSDQMTVDWFKALPGDRYEKHLFFTENQQDTWKHKLKGHLSELYDLPDLGLDTEEKITGFITEFIQARNIDIVHVMNSMAGYKALPAIKGKCPGVKVVSQLHCYDYLPDGTKAGYPALVPEQYDDYVDVYNVVSMDLAREMLETVPGLNPDKFKVIYCCVDSKRYDPGVRDQRPGGGKFKILFIGRLDEQKKPLRMAEVALGLKNKGLDFQIDVIGGGSLSSLETELKEFIAAHDLEGQVMLRGFQPRSSIKDWYRTADCLLMTSEWEGIPVVIYESMSMGLACVVPGVGGIAELVTSETGVLVENSGDIEAYVRALSEMCANRDKTRIMGEAGRKRIVSEFDLSRIGDDYINFYDNLLGR